METLQRRSHAIEPMTSQPLQAKTKPGGQSATDAGAEPALDAPAAAEGGGEGTEGAEPWHADGELMQAMGLGDPERGAEGGQDGTENVDARKRTLRQRRGKPGAKSAAGEAGAKSGEAGAKSAAAEAGGPVQRKGEVDQVGDLLGGRGPQSQSAALAAIPTSGGAPVDRGIAAGVERATGQSVGDVRVHTGEASAAAANSISARAFTTGNDIHLGASESPGDRHLMSHELAHTIQQTQGAKVAPGVSAPSDSLEVEADRIADAAVAGGQATVTTAAGGGTLMRDAVSDVEALLSYGAFDWAITDDEATQALGILAAMPTAQLNGAIARLGQTYKTRLLENLPEAAKRTSGYTKVLVAMGPDAVQPYVTGLLSYGIFDWAVTAAETAEVFQIMRALPADQQRTLAGNLGATFRSRLAQNLQRISAVGPEEYALLRVLFDATPEAEIMTLCRWTALRFNLRVESSTDSAGAAWDKRGLRRCWDVLQMLPAEHIESNGDLKSLTRYRSGSIEGWASNEGEAAIGYGDGNDIDATLETGDFTDAGDPLRGTNMFDATVRHEIGHRVDESVGGPTYTASDAGGGWETWDSTDGMAARMVSASGGKIHTWANADQKAAIIACLQTVVVDRVPDEIDDRLEALDFVADHATDAAQAALLTDIKNDDAVRALRMCFSDQGPWGTATGGIILSGRIYQESYDWPQWVSYKHEARARKVSQYQFRAPGEWFAEAYAAYYQPPGAKGQLLVGRDDATKAWFDSNVDPQHGAGGTTPAPAAGAPAPAPAPGPGPGPAPAPGP